MADTLIEALASGDADAFRDVLYACDNDEDIIKSGVVARAARAGMDCQLRALLSYLAPDDIERALTDVQWDTLPLQTQACLFPCARHDWAWHVGKPVAVCRDCAGPMCPSRNGQHTLYCSDACYYRSEY